MKQELIFTHFYNLAYLNNTPVSVVIELLTKCNLNCEHCYLPNHKNSGMDTEKVKNLLFELRQMGVVNVLFTGGEILLRYDIFELIETARSLYMRVTILSNGTLLDFEKVERLSKLYITGFSTTMFSLKSNIHDSITGVNGSLDSLLSNLQLLKEHKIRVKVKMPIMKSNGSCVNEVRRYCEQNKFEFLSSPTIYSKNDGDESPKSLRLERESLLVVIKEIDKLNNFKISQVHLKDVPCVALFYSFAIDCNGDVFPCNSLLIKVGNVFEDKIRDIWFESDLLKKIKNIRNEDLKECFNCEYKMKCERCPGMALLDNKDILACDKYAKSIAEIRLKNYCEEING